MKLGGLRKVSTRMGCCWCGSGNPTLYQTESGKGYVPLSPLIAWKVPCPISQKVQILSKLCAKQAS